MKSRKGFSLKSVAIIIIVTAIITSLTTGLIIYNNSKLILGSASLSNDSALKEFNKAFEGKNYIVVLMRTTMKILIKPK